MRSHFDPDEIQTLGRAFDAAWHTLKNETDASDRETVRDHIGRAIIQRALKNPDDERLDASRLASYAAYQARRMMGGTVADITIRRPPSGDASRKHST